VSAERTKTALQAAFLHTVCSLYALYEELGASEELREATAEVLAGVIRAHIRRAEEGASAAEQPLLELLEDDHVRGEDATEEEDEDQ